MIGEWKHTDSNKNTFDQTGVYGFHNGAMSYAFKEDGTAFLGEDGKGRINFNGNDATIYSPFYDDKPAQGMKIDLNAPYISLKGQHDSSNKGEIYISAEENTEKPFKIGDNFSVKWDGTIYATNGNFEGTISASVLKSNEGGITLDGYLTLPISGDQEEGTGVIPQSYFGSLSSSIGDAILQANGIGMQYSNSVVKATGINAGMSSGSAYISVAKQIVLDNETLTNVVSIGGSKLTCNIPAANQFGIYARFA